MSRLHNIRSGSGSGGSIYIVTSTLSGEGIFQANGGAGEVGGGGGRIAIYYDTFTFDLDNIKALGGQGSYAVGQDGTVYIEQR
jgi:hypothetical protein